MTNHLHKNDLPANVHFGDVVAIDTETLGLNPMRDRLCVVQLSDGNGDAHLVQFDGDDYSAPNLRTMLADETILKLFHFARFDLAVLKYNLHVMPQNIYCTRTASKLSRTYTDNHGLKVLCEEILGIDISKKQQSSYWGIEELTEKQIDYAANDVLHLHQLYGELNLRLEREGRLQLALGVMEFLPTRAELDLSGWDGDIFAH
ncbi:MAG: ribonuclease D [Alphaproteobacteria bacterium CG11_big_fil_rev_8_21_14_0_20_44_7]|nr:MAG: ribonuclease D [Alphaproteobacteria bacterium CG11_big_fil_rev_8_21_14_0_20_44_7]